MDEAVDYVLLAMTDIVEVHAAVFRSPGKNEVNGGRDGFELALGDPVDLVGFSLLHGGVGRPVAFRGRQDGVEGRQLPRDREGLISH